jgi:ribosomal protein S18 acetylase RimI-like enzyme
MTGADLEWRVEQACFNAWPATRQIVVDGWAFRASGGPTRRANCAHPLHAGAAMTDALIDKGEAFYGRFGRPPMFRVPEIAGEIDARLAARGYVIDAPTRTLCAPLAMPDPSEQPDVCIETAPSRRWLNARDRLSGSDAQGASAFRAIVGSVLLPCGFASVAYRGRIVSVAFGARQDDLLVIESVVTDPAYRGRGFARDCVGRLLRWAAGEGCRMAALQVMADNAPALGLYAGLGFTRDLYRYHYRIGH